VEAAGAAARESVRASPYIEVRGVTKRYGSLYALRGADLELYPGEVVGLVGDNGAGKSTLVNILSGGLQPTTGTVLVDGKEVSFRTPVDARAAGIETVYQDLSLAPDLSIWANMFLGREEVVRGPLGRIGWLDRKAMIAKTTESLDDTNIRIASVLSRVEKLSGGQRQAVAVGRAVSWGSRALLMDEPTAALGVEQQARVGELVKRVASNGIAVLLISHNLPQVYEICDRVVVLFRGETVANLTTNDVDIDDIVGWITGSALAARKLHE
jgi:simple sugar transport system ATP-binding protein